jgi:DNA-binding transcriptional LysR family regulator
VKTRIDWDDLRYVMAVADSGSLAGAAAALRVNRTTVLRRINAFERKQGVRLFERSPDGYALTAAGDEILAAARGFEATIATLERKLAGRDLRAEGSVRVTTTDTLLASVLPPVLASFQATNPKVELSIGVSNALLNLSKRDADVAIRPVAQAPERLVGRRICAVAFAIYRPADAIDSVGEDLSGQRWIAADETLAGTSVARWMRSAVPAARVGFRLDSLLAMREVCAAGGGLAALPCYLADIDARLVRVRPPIKEMSTELWVLTHPDLARTTRIRLFVNHVTAAFGRERALIEGQRPRLGS